MKIIIIFLGCLLPQILFAQNFEIKLKIIEPENKVTDSAALDLTTYYNNDIALGPKHIYNAKIMKNSAIIKDTISASEVAMLSLRVGSRFTSNKIVIDPGATYNITYNLINKKFDVVSDSKSDNLLRVFFGGLDSLRKLKDLRLALHKQFISTKNVKSADSILKLVDNFNNDLRSFSKRIASSHPNNVVSPYILTGNKDFDLEEQKIYENFSDEVKRSSYGRLLKEKIGNASIGNEIEKKVTILNEDFIPIPGNTLKNIPLQLNEQYFKGNKSKVTLIEFWASWCIPCRESMKKLYPFYYLNKSKGFNVILVSLDDDLEKWKDASKSDNYPWLNISDGKGHSSETPKNYNINAIPANVLVNAEGKIIARNIFDLETIKQILDK